MSYAIALEGATQAARRVLDSIDDRQAIGVAATEAAMWVAALDEDLGGKRRSTTARTAYQALRDRDGLKDLLFGMRHVRNQALHELVLLSKRTGGLSYPLTYPLSWPPIVAVWAPDTAPGKFLDHHAAYLAALAGEPVHPTLVRAIRFLRSATDTLAADVDPEHLGGP